MECVGLYDLMKSLEYGTKIHISVVFLDDFGNQKTLLPLSQTIHSKPICSAFKCIGNGHNKCIRFRNLVLKKAKIEKKPFGGCCINGIYEYCYPVVINNAVVCVIFVGNILPLDSKRLSNKLFDNSLIDTLETNFDYKQCEKLSLILESYIRFLFKEFPQKKKSEFNPLIENIKNYIEENLNYDFKVTDFSKIFNYNEKYIGKLFKSKTGISIKEYINQRRIEIAEKLLLETTLSITNISLKVGFNNVSYFNRVFKSVKNMTPGEYRISAIN